MKAPTFAAETFPDNAQLTRVQTPTRAIVQAIRANALADGVFVTKKFTAASTAKIAHGLGRQPQGWLTTDRNTAATLFRTAWDADTITLTASAALTVTLWVF